jgi:mannose-6-phosphate isomerase-like protein (cupin superfamily)
VRRCGSSAAWSRSRRTARPPTTASPWSRFTLHEATARRCTCTRREDEWFYVTDGELTFWVGGQIIEAPAGAFVYGPRDIPHTFQVTSDETRFLLVAEPPGFERFVRSVAQPAPSLTLPPPPSVAPDPTPLVAAAADYGIEITGPPGLPS